ncbi:MAG: capsular biosynthesis protein [Chloroflexi bacterium RBG_16_57_9]|nr:MAG: capsular biosynthesis protein [Chloroflexi bacterium RBG_16_57_9]
MTDTQADPLVTLVNPRSAVAEAYRSLRTNLEFSSLDHPLRTMILTSAAPEEGKSVTLANLAVAMAQAGKRVIVADCDLRRPSQHRLFELRQNPGLTTMILEESALNRPPLQSTSVPNLQVLTSGPLPPNPAELLSSQRMIDVIKALADQADVVLFDAPPVIAVTDAVVLAAKVDGVLLVVQAGRTRREHVEKAKALLDKVNARVVGSILTNVRADSSLQYYYAAQE